MLQKRDMLAPIPDEIMDKCKKVARVRTNQKLARSSWTNTKKSHESQETIELRGIVCEASLALTLEVDVEQVFKTGNRSAMRGSDTGDIVYDNCYIDVKGVKLPYSNLLISVAKKNTPIDVFVLVHGREWGNRFLGAIPFHKAFGQNITTAYGEDLGNGVRQEDLLDLETAIKEAKEERLRIRNAMAQRL